MYSPGDIGGQRVWSALWCCVLPGGWLEHVARQEDGSALDGLCIAVSITGGYRTARFECPGGAVYSREECLII